MLEINKSLIHKSQASSMAFSLNGMSVLTVLSGSFQFNHTLEIKVLKSRAGSLAQGGAVGLCDVLVPFQLFELNKVK